jgi:hypothetical protein
MLFAKATIEILITSDMIVGKTNKGGSCGFGNLK